MKKLIAIGALAFAVCADAEEKSFWNTVFPLDEDSDVVAEAAAKADSGIAKLIQQMSSLKAKINEAKSMPGDKLDELKKRYDGLKAKLKAKIDEFRAKQAQREEEETEKAEERRAKVEQAKKDGKDLINGFKSLFD